MIGFLKILSLSLLGILTSILFRSSNAIVRCSLFIIVAFSIFVSVIVSMNIVGIYHNIEVGNCQDDIYYRERIEELENEVDLLEEKNSMLEQKISIAECTKSIITYLSGIFTPYLKELVEEKIEGIREKRKNRKQKNKKRKNKKRENRESNKKKND